MAAPKGNNFNPKGRSKKEIDWEEFEKLCALQCTQSEIASFLKIHPNTLSDRVIDKYEEDYSTVYKKYSETGKCSLRRHQFVLSKKNAAMAIWLGKQWLGQKDTIQEMIVTNDLLERHDAIMNQLKQVQLNNYSTFKNADINKRSEIKSE